MQEGRRAESDLSQRALQVEARIGRLLRRDRPVGSQQAPAEHVVAGAVDGFDPDELPGLITEGGERPRPRSPRTTTWS